VLLRATALAGATLPVVTGTIAGMRFLRTTSYWRSNVVSTLVAASARLSSTSFASVTPVAFGRPRLIASTPSRKSFRPPWHSLHCCAVAIS
jgi:hypothetical protein